MIMYWYKFRENLNKFMEDKVIMEGNSIAAL